MKNKNHLFLKLSKSMIILSSNNFRFEALAKLNKFYFVKDTMDFCLMSDALENIPNLTLNEQYTFSLAPLKISFNERKLERSLATLKDFA